MRVRLRYGHWVPKLLKVEGIVLYPFVLFAGPEGKTSPVTLQHEMIHVRQVRAKGFARFYAQYAAEYMKGRLRGLAHDEAYARITFEVDAYRDQAHVGLTARERAEIKQKA